MPLPKKADSTVVTDIEKHSKLISDISLKALDLEQYISHEH